MATKKDKTKHGEAEVLTKHIVKKSRPKRLFDYTKVPEGKHPYKYLIRNFAYSEKFAPYKDPDTIILAVIEQEVERFVMENYWADMVYVKKVVSGKMKRVEKNESEQTKAAFAIYDAYLFFKREKPMLERQVDRLRGKWARIFRKRLPIMKQRYMDEGKPLAGYEETITITVAGRKRKLKVHRSPDSDMFNLPEPPDEAVASENLRNAEAELEEKSMKAYRAVIDNIRHLWC